MIDGESEDGARQVCLCIDEDHLSDSHSNSPDYWTSSITALIADDITFVCRRALSSRSADAIEYKKIGTIENAAICFRGSDRDATLASPPRGRLTMGLYGAAAPVHQPDRPHHDRIS